MNLLRFFALRAAFRPSLLCARRSGPLIIEFMANGWESKSVEALQIDQQEQIRSQEVVDEKERLGRLKAEVARKVQALQLTRARIREQLSRTSNERYTLLLNTELQQIDGELAKLV